MDYYDKKINELQEQYDKLERNRMDYLEADMNREAGRISKKMYKISDEISQLREKQEYGLNQDMKKAINLYKKFLDYKGLNKEFESFAEKEEQYEEAEF